MFGIAAILVALLIGVLSGGAPSNLGRTVLKFEVPLLLLFVAQGLARGRLLGLARSSALGFWIWAISSVALFVLLLLNARKPGMAVAALGVLLNLDVVLANGAMPIVSSAAGASTTTAVTKAVHESAGFYQAANAATLARVLADAIPLRVPGGTTLLSAGDLVLAVGVIAVIVAGMTDPDKAVHPQWTRK